MILPVQISISISQTNPSLLQFLSLITSFSFAQSVRFDGLIQDEQKNPLEMANIMAINNGTKAMDSYGITNDKGKFQLTLKPNTAYTIKVSYLGMKSKEIAVSTKAENMTQNIVLDGAGIELEGVEIVREMPVSIKGDTIVYNADSFKSGTEKKLEDVLKKLPGVEVNADGEIEVEGKKVSKLMVEGKDFFDGDTKLGVKNIPADAIDKVQVLRNYNEISQLKGLENDHPNIYFGQLYGMSDNITFYLSDKGYNAAKYLPYGPVKDVVPYLTRRARENTSVAGQTGRELGLIMKELKRRKSQKK